MEQPPAVRYPPEPRRINNTPASSWRIGAVVLAAMCVLSFVPSWFWYRPSGIRGNPLDIIGDPGLVIHLGFLAGTTLVAGLMVCFVVVGLVQHPGRHLAVALGLTLVALVVGVAGVASTWVIAWAQLPPSAAGEGQGIAAIWGSGVRTVVASGRTFDAGLARAATVVHWFAAVVAPVTLVLGTLEFWNGVEGPLPADVEGDVGPVTARGL